MAAVCYTAGVTLVQVQILLSPPNIRGNMFTNIQIISRRPEDYSNKCPLNFGESLAWKFKYGKHYYGQVITTEIYGELKEEYDDDGLLCGSYRPIIGYKDFTNKDIIRLFKKMINTMEKLEEV